MNEIKLIENIIIKNGINDLLINSDLDDCSFFEKMENVMERISNELNYNFFKKNKCYENVFTKRDLIIIFKEIYNKNKNCLIEFSKKLIEISKNKYIIKLDIGLTIPFDYETRPEISKTIIKINEKFSFIIEGRRFKNIFLQGEFEGNLDYQTTAKHSIKFINEMKIMLFLLQKFSFTNIWETTNIYKDLLIIEKNGKLIKTNNFHEDLLEIKFFLKNETKLKKEINILKHYDFNEIGEAFDDFLRFLPNLKKIFNNMIKNENENVFNGFVTKFRTHNFWLNSFQVQSVYVKNVIYVKTWMITEIFLRYWAKNKMNITWINHQNIEICRKCQEKINKRYCEIFINFLIRERILIDIKFFLENEQIISIGFMTENEKKFILKRYENDENIKNFKLYDKYESDEIEIIENNFNQAYKLRNRIIHGNEINPNTNEKYYFKFLDLACEVLQNKMLEILMEGEKFYFEK